MEIQMEMYKLSILVIYPSIRTAFNNAQQNKKIAGHSRLYSNLWSD